MIVFLKRAVLGASVLLSSCTTSSQGAPTTSSRAPKTAAVPPSSAVTPVTPVIPAAVANQTAAASVAKPSASIPLMNRAVPIPKDLCAAPNQKALRRRIEAALRRPAKNGLGKGSASPLVPCEHGELRVLQFSVSKQKILVLLEEDYRPSYISGGSARRSFAVVDRGVVFDHESLWDQIVQKETLHDADIVNLLVAALMLQGINTMILNSEQREAVVLRWPEAENAFLLDPPALRKKDKDHPILQAWMVHSYNERGVSCQYLDGMRVTFSGEKGLQLEQNHKYAAGTRMGQPCGDPLPSSAKKP